MPKVAVRLEMETGGEYAREWLVGVERSNLIPGMGASLAKLTEEDIDQAVQVVDATLAAAREQAMAQLDQQRAIVRARTPQGGPSRDHVPAHVGEGI